MHWITGKRFLNSIALLILFWFCKIPKLLNFKILLKYSITSSWFSQIFLIFNVLVVFLLIFTNSEVKVNSNIIFWCIHTLINILKHCKVEPSKILLLHHYVELTYFKAHSQRWIQNPFKCLRWSVLRK